MNEIERLVRDSKHPVALTGAGISAPSGIPTFQGNWQGEPIRKFLTRDFFLTHRVRFFELFIDMQSWCDKEPNAAHRALAALNIPVITQNIDGLHEKAGTKIVHPLHGTLHTVHCERCGRVQSAKAFADALRPLYRVGDAKAIEQALRCPCCGGWIDTDVVLYGDSIHHLSEAVDLSESADLMLVIGTSLTTYPAAALPDLAKQHGAKIVLINDDCVKTLEGVAP